MSKRAADRAVHLREAFSRVRLTTAILVCASFLLAPLLALVPPVSSDPVDTSNPDYTRTVTWDLDAPSDYNLSDMAVSDGLATLEFLEEEAVVDSEEGYADGTQGNVNVSRVPGSIVLDKTTTFSTTVTLQPDGVAGVDTYISEDKETDNYGGDEDMKLDSETGKRYHMLLEFDLSSIPVNAIVHEASLELCMIPGGKTSEFVFDVFALERGFVEDEATWLRASAAEDWTTPGGDFLPESYHRSTLNNTIGWRSMDVTELVERWVLGDLANNGLGLVPQQIGGDAVKVFASSDEATAVQNRPRLTVTYAIEGNEGAYESAVLGPGTNSTFRSASWSNDTLSYLTDEFGGTSLSADWTWLNDPTLSGGSYNVGVSTPGWLRVTGAANAQNVDSSLGSNFLYQDVTGDFVAVVSVRELFTVNSMDAGLLLVESNNSWMSISKTDISTSGKIRVIVCENGVSGSAAILPWGSQTTALFKVVRNDTGVWFHASSYGLEWTEVYRHDPSAYLSQRLSVGVFLQSASSAQPVAEFDYFRVDPLAAPEFRYYISTGNSSSASDPSWSDWMELSGDGGTVLDTVAKYFRFRVYLSTPHQWFTPAFHGTEVGWERFAGTGVLETHDCSPADFSVWLTMETVHSDDGGTVEYYYSTNGGSTWEFLGSGTSAGIYSQEPTMRFRAVVKTHDTLTTPTIDRISVVYGTALCGFHVEAPAQVVAGEEFAVDVWAKNSENFTMSYWVGLITLHALDEALGDASGELHITSWLIASGGRTTVDGQMYLVAETIVIEVGNGEVWGHSEPVEVVSGDVAGVAILPEDVDTLLEGTDETFEAVAYDEHGNAVPGCGYQWNVTGGIGELDRNDSQTVVLSAGQPFSEGYLNVSVGDLVASRHITVEGIGHPPIFTDIVPDQQAYEDGPTWSFDLSDYVYDVQDGDGNLRWFVTGEDLVTASGENQTGNLVMTLTPRPDAFGNDTLTLHVVDPEGSSSAIDVFVGIAPVNDAPVIAPIQPLVVHHDVPYAYSLRYYITDVDNDPGDLSLSVDYASEAYVDVDNDRLSLIFDCPFALIGSTQSVVVTVSDGDLSSSTIIHVTVTDDNVPMLVESLPDVFMMQGEVMQGAFDLDEYFMDPDEDVLYYTSRTTIVQIGIDEDNSVTIHAPLAGEEHVTFSAVDPQGARMEDTILVTVMAVNQPPTISAVPDLRVRYDRTYEFDLERFIADEDDGIDALVISTDDGYIAVIGTTLSIRYPASFDGQVRVVNVTVSDGEYVDWWLTNITITDNAPPESLGPPDHSFTEDWPIQYPPSGELEVWFTDMEDDELEFEAFSWSEDVSVSAVTNALGNWVLRFTTTANYFGESKVTVRAVDDEGAFVEDTITLTVTPSPDAPVFNIQRHFNVTVGVESTIDLSCCVLDPDSEPWQMTLSVPSEYADCLTTASTLVRMNFPESFLEPGEVSRTVEVVVRMTDQDGLWDTSTMRITVSRIVQDGPASVWGFVLFLIAVGTAVGLFGMVLTMRRKPFVIRDMMVVHEDGFLISRHAEHQEEDMDEDVFTGMMTAVLNFVEDSMSTNHEQLKFFGFEHYRVMVQRGKKIYAAIIFEGDRPKGIEEDLGGFLRKIESIYRKSLKEWSGDIDADFAGMELLVKGFVSEHTKRGRGRNGNCFLKRRSGDDSGAAEAADGDPPDGAEQQPAEARSDT